ncbi:precorrin-3B C(17)-methyltransferase [Corynebacterium choanae]|uniref:Precorrin-3B C(17)-methyltransferase n=1 Tax=Corynebacterium choanae TaxID=1862358 RepID=A0A3G6J622_9CORY|nr:precorrin-3B C(17)-methyltransferase [Corynebacterium choanae]AZA13551.1 Precorrin-3B C(17)-methyltransferase [Corynebacterium choanae]
MNTPQSDQQLPAGTLYGIGVGPGSKQYLTVAAIDALQSADVIAYHCKHAGSSAAFRVVEDYVDAHQMIEELVYPVTSGNTDHPGGYAGAMADFYRDAVTRLSAHLQAGRSVAVIALGDPMLHSSQQHLFRELRDVAAKTTIIPGISSVSAACALTEQPLAEDHQIASIIPATCPYDRLVAALGACDTAVVIKLGRTFDKVRAAAEEAGVLHRATVVTRIGMSGQRLIPLATATSDDAPYFSVVQIHAAEQYTDAQGKPDSQDVDRARKFAADNDHTDATNTGGVVVVGLGPGNPQWTTPETSAALAEADTIIGYDTYVRRVQLRPGQRALPSDNMVEIERAVMALDFAKQGHRVAVVSSGDPGVFAMATAVMEAADDPAFAEVPVTVLPGMTAAQAVASRVGAPLGHDFGMISLSNRLKPWSIIARRIHALAGADMAFAVYNPASKTRREQLVEMFAIVSEYRSGDTPVIIARAVGSDSEQVTVTTLAKVDPSIVDMRTMVIVGASTTTSYETAFGTRVYTSRSYPS